MKGAIVKDMRALLLAIINLLAGTLLLLLSAWFIAAAALAGMSAVATGFNYVIPAALIRLLAFVRILSGYGEKYFGHESLLQRLNLLRLQVFERVVSSSANKPKAEEMELLLADTDAAASQWLAVTNPVLSTVVLLCVVALALWLLLPEQLPFFLMVVMAVIVMGYVHFLRIGQAYAAYSEQQAACREALGSYLQSASLWNLMTQDSGPGRHQSLWRRTGSALRFVQAAAEWRLTAISLVAVLCSLLWIQADGQGGPLLICLPLLVLAMPDWLAQGTRAMLPLAQANNARQRLSRVSGDTATPAGHEPAQSEASVQALSWRRSRGNGGSRHGKPLTVTFRRGEIIWLKGSSGSGKSSLLQALCGLGEFRGELLVDQNPVIPGNLTALTPFPMVYSEQYPAVLSDTLKRNVLLAHAGATDNALTQALHDVGMERLSHCLDQWVGSQGRLLSGGEIKRLGMARVLLSGADVWLLDEPFAGLDAESVSPLIQCLLRERQRRICLVASHRIPPGLLVDQVVDLD